MLTEEADDPLVPLHLLIWAIQAGLTTFTCIVEYSSWLDFSSEERRALAGLYGPYLALGNSSSPLRLKDAN